METGLRGDFENLKSSDDKIRFTSFQRVLEVTEKKVPWIYEVWDDLLQSLRHENSYQRSIAAMVLCNLARSDSENRMRKEIGRLLALTTDEKFVTSRQCIQSIWKVAASSAPLQKGIVEHLSGLFADCINGKHYNLIRQDIVQSLKNLHDEIGDEKLRKKAAELIATEKDAKYRKKYEAVWRA
jgi:hypothetical protein